MARSTNNTKRKSAGSTLAPLTDPHLAPPASRLEGRKLAPMTFRPETGRPEETDGAPLSRLGWRFREVFAEAHHIAEADVDLGLVRQVEALDADSDLNLHHLSVPQVKRTEHGTLLQVRMVVNTPLLQPWLLNGRALRRMGSELKGATKIVTKATDHPVFRLPVMEVDGPDAVLEIVSAQRRLLGLENYTVTTGHKKDRVNSIVQFGVLDPPEVVLTQLVSPDGSAWVPQAAEGAQRLFSALLAMDALANRDVSVVGTEAWFNRGTRLRDLTPVDIDMLADTLRFSATGAAGYIPGRDIAGWMETVAEVDPAAVAFQLLRTMEVNLVLAVDPDPVVTAAFENPVSETIQEMIRGYHMPGKAKDAWNDADINGLIAIGAIDEFADRGRIGADERHNWLGEQILPWDGPGLDGNGAPGNRLVSVTKLLAALTAQGALPPEEVDDHLDSLTDIVNHHLRINGRRVHADDRAKVAAAQAIVALEMYRDGWENTLQAALFGVFRHPWFWKVEDQSGSWPDLLGMNVADLATQAKAERAADPDPEAGGPAQRAIAALGGVALMINPGLIEAGEALTRTGLGGGGKTTSVRASDPSVLLKAMAHNDEGIDELRDAIAALSASAVPTIPIDRTDKQQLTDFYLRRRWLGGDDSTTDNPFTEFARLVQELVNGVDDGSLEADRLRTLLPGDLIGEDRPDEADDEADEDENAEHPDDGDLWGDPVFETIGVNEEAVAKALAALQNLSDFFHTGRAYARAAGRAGR